MSNQCFKDRKYWTRVINAYKQNWTRAQSMLTNRIGLEFNRCLQTESDNIKSYDKFIVKVSENERKTNKAVTSCSKENL